ncbi:Phosphatidylglycerol phospholipase C [Cladophialophora carrionii]|uniref:Phosphatidylglycerol phospholipase C n=1 Tax=Cladophialophora carrionii TaxID=86049 RepID=A0A1C1CIY6_9EURO|nr:Phosphatidylglycerol phospholipase C [Cladophialophora carrionii]
MHHRTDVEASEPLLKEPSRIGHGDLNYGSQRASGNAELDFPMPSWAQATMYGHSKQLLPQAIAHRGFKAEHPENTMDSFVGAVDVGAHAIETDIHLSKDGVVVLSHDPDLKRCFGLKDKIIECDWQFLSSVRTIREPHVPMPRLQDLLEYVAQPDLQHIWLFLDIKMDNDSDDVMRLIAKTLASVHPGARPWNNRVILGIWAAKYLPLCSKYLPGFPVSHIGFSTVYARQFLKVPNVSFSMLQKVLFGPFGSRFMRDVRRAHRPLYAWTVNDTNLMKWCIQHQLAGVVTDDPQRFRRICEGWDDQQEPPVRQTWFQWFYTIYVWILIAVFSRPFRRKFPETVEQYIQKKNIRAKAAETVEEL